MKALFCLIWVMSSLLSAFAAEEKLFVKALTNEGTKRINVFRYTNHWGRKEIRLESAALPRIGRVNPIYGYGRDTDDDEIIDTWFMIDNDEGLKVTRLANRQPWASDIIKNQLFKTYQSSAKSHFSALYGAVFGFLLMSVSHGYTSEIEFWRERMDLEEFALRLEAAKKSGQLTKAQWDAGVDLVMASYEDSLARFERATGRDYAALGAADVALWATGGVIIKYVGKGLSFLGRPLMETTMVRNARAAVIHMARRISQSTRAKLSYFRRAKGAPVAVIAAQTARAQFPRHMRGLMAKNTLMKKLVPFFVRSGVAVKKALYDWKYIAFMASLQISTEAFANRSEVYSPNPTTFAKNVLTHPDIVQNVGFMTTNAFFMTAASHGIRPRGVRFATCGFIALGNSSITNFVIKGESDYQRVAVDSGWEAIIGNTQVQIDLAALKHFEQKALAANNPRLKLLGWAVVLVDQAAGFAGYSMLTRSISRDTPDVQLVPVVAE